MNVNRRKMLRKTAIFGAASLIGVHAGAEEMVHGSTPPLTQEEITIIEDAIGKRGNYNKEQGVHTIALPRNDLGTITIKGEVVPIAFGFAGWVSFKKTVDGKRTIMMSDVVLLEKEVNQLISAALVNGLDVSAIHNHFFHDDPRMCYMHIHKIGTVQDLAKKFTMTIKDSKIHPSRQPELSEPFPTAKEIFDLPELDAIVKTTGKVNGQVYKYTIGREDLKVMAMGAQLTSAIGLNSWASFTGTKENAYIAGDIAMLEYEVSAVIKALRNNNIEVVAVHNHMIGEDPRVIFLHYLGKGNPSTLAQGFRAALDVLGRRKDGNKH